MELIQQRIIKQNKDCEASLWKIKMSSSNVLEECRDQIGSVP